MGPLAPFLLAAMESFLPPLPLVAIVTLGYAKKTPKAPKRKEGRFVIV